MSDEIVYVIPSYKRPDILRKNTLQMLQTYGVPSSHIYVFIADDPDEAQSYDYLHKLGVHVKVGPVGLKNMRNFITKSFPNGTRMVCIDDDVKELVYMMEDPAVENIKSCKRYPLTPYPSKLFQQWMKDTFDYMQGSSIQLFGVYPVRNGYFMKSMPSVTSDLRFCVGAFWGCINDTDVQLTLDEKEDTERTLQSYVKYGKILRFNHVAPVTRYYKTKGGMQASEMSRIEAGKEAAYKIVATYPALCSITNYKKSGTFEVRFTKPKSGGCQTQTTCYPHWLPTKDPLVAPQPSQQTVC